MNKNDVFLGITTSGHSKNILRALEKCQELNIQTIVFTGYDGGLVKALANYCVIACGDSVATIQELHIVLAHTLCECVEKELLD
jgi:D-sedoheptulose 7-phosphate isomerase